MEKKEKKRRPGWGGCLAAMGVLLYKARLWPSIFGRIKPIETLGCLWFLQGLKMAIHIFAKQSLVQPETIFERKEPIIGWGSLLIVICFS